MSDIRNLAQRVLDLDAQATPGPWTNSFDKDGNADDVVVWAPMQPEASDFIGNVGAWQGNRTAGVMFDLDVKNAALIAEYRTAAPALARALLAALDEVARLRASLEGVVAVAADRQAFVMEGPRAFARAERIAKAALAAPSTEGT